MFHICDQHSKICKVINWIQVTKQLEQIHINFTEQQQQFCIRYTFLTIQRFIKIICHKIKFFENLTIEILDKKVN